LLNSISNVIDPVNCNIYGGTDKTTIDGLRSTIDSVKTSIETTRASLLSGKSSLDTLDLAFNNASQNLETKKHPYTNEDIDTQKAIVDQAKANVDNYLSLYNKTLIYAPFDSKVTKIVPEVGNIINANSTVISLIGGDTYQIETYVAESDIAKIKINNSAKVTLDAYSSDIIFAAKVLQIDLSATDIEGVASYKTILKFDKEDQRIMPGMTANIDIVSNKKENVIYVPSRAIITKNGKKFVKLIIDNKNKVQETNVVAGIRGSDGRTEIISGLQVGDKIIMN
jgi:RND family efflux transporter MFP subunit